MRVYQATDGSTYPGDNRKVWLVLANSFMEAGLKAESDIRERIKVTASYSLNLSRIVVDDRELRSLVLLGETND